MSDDDLIRRGDAKAAAAVIYKWSIAAGEELEVAIAALPEHPAVKALVAEAEARGMERAAGVVEAQGKWMQEHNLVGNGFDLIQQGKAIRAEAAAIRKGETP